MDVSEIVVRATPEGLQNTTDQVDEMSDGVEDSTDEMDEQAGAMSNLSGKFAGAMGAIAAGFAVVSGTLLSNVPVLGEAAAGLGSILSAVGLKMDAVLRPAIQPLTEAFFGLSQKINDADGATGKLIGVFGSVVAIVGVVGSIIAGAITTFLALGGSMATVISIAGTVVSAIGGVIGTILSLPVILGVAIAALVGFAAAYLTNWKGTRDKTDEIIGKIKDLIINGFKTFKKKALKALKKFVKITKEKFGTIKDKAAEKLGEIVSDAKQFGKDLVSGFANGIRSRISAAVNAAKELVSKVRSYLPSSPADTGPLSDLDKTGPGLVNTFALGIDKNLGTVKQSSEQLGNAASPAASALDRQSGKTIIEIEGRQVERATRSFRSDGTDLRGRYG